MKVLVLGGTSEARGLAALLAACSGVEAVMSLAGRTSAPAPQPIPVRVGGFGGAEGLAHYLDEQRIDVLVDATHPFAANISRNAEIAAAALDIPLVILSRLAWTRDPQDRWVEVPDMVAAAETLGQEPRRVFLAIGRLQLAAFRAAPQHFYLIRSIDPMKCDLPHYRVILARGPFDADAEERLLIDERIDVIIAKNSGAPAVFGKILAARRLGLPVVMVARPHRAAQAAHDPETALHLILHHGARHRLRAPAPRGV